MFMPKDSNLTLGRGQVFFDRFPIGGSEGFGERYIGNTPSFQITRSIERLARRTSYRGTTKELPGKVLSESMSMSMTTDNIGWDNFAEWLSDANWQSANVPAITVPVNETIVVRRDRHYQLGKNVSPVGAGKLGGLTLMIAQTLRPLIAGVDYIADLDGGRFSVPGKTTSIANGESVVASYTRLHHGINLARTRPTELYGAVRYISFNEYGPRTNWYFPKVRLSPQGGWEQKGDEFQQMRFNMVALRLGPAHPLAYASRLGEPPQAITADTTLVSADTTFYSADNGVWTE